MGSKQEVFSTNTHSNTRNREDVSSVFVIGKHEREKKSTKKQMTKKEINDGVVVQYDVLTSLAGTCC